MFIPLWFVVVMTLLTICNFALSVVIAVRRNRHHDHLLPTTPARVRSPRG